MTNVKSLLTLYVKMGGSLTDTYADIAGGIPVGQYSTISDAIIACSKKYSSGGGSYTLPTASADTKGGVKIGSGLSMDGEVLSATGGAEKFVVTLTEDDGTWTADETIAEIVAADEANQIVVAKYPNESVYVELPLNFAVDTQEVSGAFFVGLKNAGNDNAIVSVTCFNQGGEDVIQVTETPIPTSSNEPLVVTLTADQSTGNFVGDKTFGEVNTAIGAGKNVVLSGTLGAPMKIVPNGIVLDGSTYKLTIPFDGQFVVLQGAENDYITVSGN